MHDIITIGTATKDVYLKSPDFKHLNDEEHLKEIGFPKGEAECFALGSKMELDEIDMQFGGGATNAAVTFSRQGLKTKSLIKVGEDRAADDILENLENENVNTNVVVDKKDHTAYSTILLLPGGERTVLVYRGASEKFKKREIGISDLKSHWVYITPGRIPFSTMDWMLKNFKRRSKEVKIAMNPSSKYVERGAKKLKSTLNKLDVLILNREEAAELTGADYDDEDMLVRELNKVTDGIIVMTKGAEGSVASDGRYVFKAGTYDEKEVVDRTGAGDAFGSGFVSGLMKENDIAHAIKLASANATSVVEQVGAQPGILKTSNISRRKQFKYLDLDVEPIV